MGSWVSGSILELERGQNDEMLSHVHPSPSTSGRGLGGTTSIKICQDCRERPPETYFDVFFDFWALFCLKPTRNALFTPLLVQNCQVAVTKQVQIRFSRPDPF